MAELVAAIPGLATPLKLLVFAGLALMTHFVVIIVRRVAGALLKTHKGRRFQKLQSIGTLATSAVIFWLYFIAIGFVLQAFGVSLKVYLASASVIGLAIGFGSQGIVQDVVTGLTLVFSDLVDVGDLVEISGQTGIVRAITMRFIELENALGASVFIPNRTIGNITNYPRGYVRCIVDITLRGEDSARDAAEAEALRLMNTAHEQFPGLLIAPPSSVGRTRLTSGKEILRIKFRIWPNRGQPIEAVFNQELVAAIKKIDADYQPWMVTVSYEVEERRR